MVDVHDIATRSRNMAAIKASNTKPELIVRQSLHRLGLRFKLHVKELPGKPDIVLPKHGALVFVNGCFWHGHDCYLFKWPRSNQEFWRKKIGRTIERDRQVIDLLSADGWRVATVFECAFKGKARLYRQDAMQSLALWIRSGGNSFVLRGNDNWSPHLNNL